MENAITILVADDEGLARKRIIKLLGETQVKANILEASSGKETIDQMMNESPDIVFLDIQMTDMTGFDVLQRINNEDWPVIIFVTAFDNFAVQAFEVQAIDFLLKPYKKERFEEALQRGLRKLETEQKQEFQNRLVNLVGLLNNEPVNVPGKKYLERIVLNLNKRYFFVEIDQIKYICSSAYYAEIYTMDLKKYIYRISMSNLIEKLNPEHFIRINRSTIINLSFIKEVVSEGSGDFSISMKDGKQFSLTNNYKRAFLDKINLKNR